MKAELNERPSEQDDLDSEQRSIDEILMNLPDTRATIRELTKELREARSFVHFVLENAWTDMELLVEAARLRQKWSGEK